MIRFILFILIVITLIAGVYRLRYAKVPPWRQYCLVVDSTKKWKPIIRLGEESSWLWLPGTTPACPSWPPPTQVEYEQCGWWRCITISHKE